MVFQKFNIRIQESLVLSAKKSLEVQVTKFSIKIEKSVKFFGIQNNNHLNFDYLVNQLSEKMMDALVKFANKMDIYKRNANETFSIVKIFYNAL